MPPYQFQVRVGGLYLMYAVYQIQPISPKAKIRLTSQQWDDALYFQQQAKLQSHLDVVYIFNRLIQEQAFQFCFTSQEIGTQPNSHEGEDAEVDLADEMKEEKCIINKLFNYENLEQLSYLQDQYQRMKVALAGPKATKPDKSLNVVKEEFVEDIVL
ncbi:snRNA-activating protein complex subunit 1 [Elysia marginata]|uniref:snRNA-activating protein complex subunit 1 n=1 Tax=Elysia marginata TaxID=1093978 RepID=A0AAV4HI87_9GAST|nr:snRNA-activating protein complex subunit 1 [Elysia marginata]